MCIPTYRVFRCDRSRHGGGVAIYVSEAVLCRLVLIHDCLELLSLVLKTNAGTLLVSLIYNHGPIQAQLESALADLNVASFNESILLGDFDVDLLSPAWTYLIWLLALDHRRANTHCWINSLAY